MIKKLYADISKVEDQGDGTLKVWGYASSASEDADGEIITAEAMKAALPDYMKFGAVREMHQPKAAGTAIEASVEDDGKTFFGAHIVDSEAVKKVQAGVYKGFSVGGKVIARDELNKSIIKGIKLLEVSLVDRPANPEAVFTMYKAEGLGEGDDAGNNHEPAGGGDSAAGGPGDLGKTEGTESGAGEPNRATVLESLRKWEGQEVMDAASAMYTLRDIVWILDDENWEAENGENNPDQIAALRTAVRALKDFIISELNEDYSAEKVAKLAGAAGFVKGETALAALDELYKAAKGYSDDLKKADGPGDGDLQKLTGELDLAKAELAKVATERDDLKKRVEKLEAQPAPPKGAVKTFSKQEDSGGEDVAKVSDVKDGHGNINEVASLIKSIHAQGPIGR